MLPPPSIGLDGGLDFYWPQVEGMKERLKRHIVHTRAKLGRTGSTSVDLKRIANHEPASEAGRAWRRADLLQGLSK